MVVCLSCSKVKRPDSYICGINLKSAEFRCYNILNDFNDDGTMKTDAKPKVEPLVLQNAAVYMTPQDFEKVKVWMQDLRDFSKEHCK